jgi:diacylglycerol kinase family enzyme
MRQRFFLLFNPGAGTSKRSRCAAVIKKLTEAGAKVDQNVAQSAEQARQLAHAAAISGNYDAIIAAGGDGTVRQAAAAAAGTTCAVGAIMLGTGNVLAHELNLPWSIDAIAKMLLHGSEVEVEMALANGEPFLLMAGVGFDGRVISRLNQRLKQIVGRAAYAPAVLGVFKQPLDNLSITHKGTTTQADWVVVSNARHYGGKFVIGRHGHHVSEAGLQLIQFHARHRRQRIRQLLTLASGGVERRARVAGSGIDLSMCDDVTIAAQQPVPVQIDGDAFGTTPLRITRGGGLVKLIVP